MRCPVIFVAGHNSQFAVSSLQGLTVQLHPYQRQSLRFMLDNERREGGHRDNFWVPYTTPGGEAFLWSPILLRAWPQVSATPRGGFLAEEMVRAYLSKMPNLAILARFEPGKTCPYSCISCSQLMDLSAVS